MTTIAKALGFVVLLSICFIPWLIVSFWYMVFGMKPRSIGYFMGAILPKPNAPKYPPPGSLPVDPNKILETSVKNWDLEYSEINELRFGVIRTLEEYCWAPTIMCVNCKMLNKCNLFYIHDAVRKTGINSKMYDEMRDWATRYYRRNERS